MLAREHRRCAAQSAAKFALSPNRFDALRPGEISRLRFTLRAMWFAVNDAFKPALPGAAESRQPTDSTFFRSRGRFKSSNVAHHTRCRTFGELHRIAGMRLLIPSLAPFVAVSLSGRQFRPTLPVRGIGQTVQIMK